MQRALKKDLEERFEVAPQFAHALDSAMKSAGVQPIVEDIYQKIEPRSAQKSKRKKRPKIVYRKKKKSDGRFALAFAVLALVSVGLVGWIWMSMNSKKPKTTQVTPPKKRKLKILKGGWTRFADLPDSGTAASEEPGNATTDAGPPAEKAAGVQPPARPGVRGKQPPKRRNVRPRRRRTAPSRVRPRRRSSARGLIVLRVLSKPSGAQVFLNGQAKGTTPASLRVKQGSSVRVMLKKKGYVAKTVTVRVNKSMTRNITLIEDLF